MSRRRTCGSGADSQGAPLRRKDIEIFHPVMDFAGVFPSDLPSSDPQQPGDPTGEKLNRSLRGRQGEGPQPDHAVLGFGRRQLQVAASQKTRQPAVGAAQVENQDPRGVLKCRYQQEIEQEALPASRGSQHQRVSDVSREKIVVVGGLPPGLQDGQLPSRHTLQRFICGYSRVRPEKILDQLCSKVRHLCLAFPDHQDAPAVILKLLPNESVPLDIAGQLRQPVGSVCGRLLSAQAAVMLMPEASVHENDLPQPGKYKIWSARKVTPVEPKTIS